MKNSRKEYFIMFAIIGVLGGTALAASFRIPAGGNLGLGADFMPKIVSVILLCCAFGFLIQALRAPKEEPVQKKEKRDPVPAIRFGIAFGMLILYTVLLKPVGFVIMTALYVFAQSLFMVPPEKRNFLFSGILAVVSSLLIYFVFAKGLSMTLPAGILDGIL